MMPRQIKIGHARPINIIVAWEGEPAVPDAPSCDGTRPPNQSQLLKLVHSVALLNERVKDRFKQRAFLLVTSRPERAVEDARIRKALTSRDGGTL